MYDLIFITHLPSFYKCNLYKEISKRKKIKIIFISTSSSIRNLDFTSELEGIDHIYINKGDFENRNLLYSFYKLIKALFKIKYREVVVGGWDLPEFWLAIFLTKKNKNALNLESSEYDCSIAGIKGIIKKFFVVRLNKVYCSGSPHERLIRHLGFNGEIKKTFGVGLTNKQDCLITRDIKEPFRGKLLYVGRLSSEKGLSFLIKSISELSNISLTVVGTGPEESNLKALAEGVERIQFLGYIENKELSKIYSSHDLFVLPSVSEPWGLVIEEAIKCGLPILCSHVVGAAEDIVLKNSLGLIYKLSSSQDFKQKLLFIEENYQFFINNINSFNFDKLIKNQIESYE